MVPGVVDEKKNIVKYASKEFPAYGKDCRK